MFPEITGSWISDKIVGEGEEHMVQKKRLNNNVIIALDEDGSEVILAGCGLGFQTKDGMAVDESKVEKTFVLTDTRMKEQFKELLKNIPIEHVKLADDIISYARIHVNSRISENVIIALCDHIYMAVERKKQGIDVKNVLLWDIKRYYQAEYQAGLYAVKLVREKFGVELQEDEAGFIALHIVNAQMDLHTKTVSEVTKVMQEIETIVRITFRVKLDEESVYYHRFISHLKFFAERVFSGKSYDGQDMAGLSGVIRAQYGDAYECSLKIAAFMEKEYRYHLSEEEILYLSIHIARIVKVMK